MELFNCLNDVEKNIIKNYITTYAMGNKRPSHPMAGLEHILRVWDFHKLDMFHLLGNNLIISKHISYEKEREDIDYELSDQLFKEGSPGSEFTSAFYHLLYNNNIFSDEQLVVLGSLLLCDNLCENIYYGKEITIPLPNGKTYRLQYCMKTMRALGKIAKEFNLPGFEDFRITHSQVLNQKTINGNLYLSIHPLDFMTMSDNNCDWDSCMSWMENGEYKQGTVEMMNSPCVVMAYIENEHDDFWITRDNTWYNKRWRELFIVDKGLITGIKGYPYENNDIENIVCDWLKELAEINLGWTYNNEYIHYVQRRIINKETMPFYVLFKTYKMYNDFHSRNRWGFFNLEYIINRIEKTNFPDKYRITYSGLSECMWCGDVISDISACSLICDSCDGRIYCSECGEELTDSDAYVYVESLDKYFCMDCYEYENSFKCDLCNNHALHSTLTSLYIANLDENLILTGNYHYFACPECIAKFRKRNAIISVSPNFMPGSFHPALDWSKLTDKEKEAIFNWTPDLSFEEWCHKIDNLNCSKFNSIIYKIGQVKDYVIPQTTTF